MKNMNSLCRCCHAVGNFKSLGFPYFNNGVKEIFSEILCETFEINIVPLSQDISVNAYCICPPCAARLRDAFVFKKQVKACEKNLLGRIKGTPKRQNVESFKTKLKLKSKTEPDDFPGIKEEYLNIYSEESDEELEIQVIDDKVTKIEANRTASNNTKPQPKKEKPKFCCSICKKVYVNTASLEIHMRKHSGEASYSCYLCVSKFFKKRDLTQHIDDSHRIDGKYACTTCNKRYNKTYVLKNHVLSHLDEKFICDYCNKEYTRKKNLKAHIKLHTGDNFECEVCNKVFFGKRQLNLHKIVHTEGKPFVCELCGTQFRQSDSIKRHIHRKHLNRKPLHACKVCDKKYWSKSYLASHERSHMNERPYSCEVCGKDYKWPELLRCHMKVHTGEKPYTCSYCDKRFSHFSNFMLHERRHTGEKPYTCKVCEKSFVESSALKIHERLHTGKRPFSCEVCDRRFNESGQLKRHMRGHTGEKDTCNICGKQYRDIYKHSKAMHASEWRLKQGVELVNTPATMNDLSDDIAEYEFEQSDG